MEEKRIHVDTSGLKDYSSGMPTYIPLLKSKMVGRGVLNSAVGQQPPTAGLLRSMAMFPPRPHIPCAVSS